MSEKLDGKITVNHRPKKDSDGSELQGRDTIYIDTDDDVTSIISRVKESSSSVVALVPPKRIGVLQSVVNLKLLQRAAKSSRKKITLVTTDDALITLAASLRIPVAKNLNTQPELIDAPDLDLGDTDVIDGNDLSIGELSKMAGSSVGRRANSKEDKGISATVEAIEVDDKIKNDLDADGVMDDNQAKNGEKKTKKKSGSKIPNFDSFRKKLLIFGGLGVLLIAFFVWAIWFAPRGTITITAKTSDQEISSIVSSLTSEPTNVDNGIIQPVVRQSTETETISFEATGSKDVGEKATGTVRLTNSSSSSRTLTVGARLTTVGGLVFTLDSAVTVPAATLPWSCPADDHLCPGSETVGVTALESGTKYNAASGYLSGAPSSVTAAFASATSGGTSEIVNVVEQSDLDTAATRLREQVDEESAKAELSGQLDSSVKVIDDSFSVSYGTVTSKPAVGEGLSSGSTTATATMEVTYSIIGVSNSDIESLIESKLESDIEDGQKVYDNGVDSVKFSNFRTVNGGYSITIDATAKVGPEIDESKIKQNSVGKKSGEIMAQVGNTSGIDDVSVNFWPFWVRSVSNADNLTVEFAIDK